MKRSIRRILLINLFLSILIIIIFSAVAVYYLGAEDVDALTDRNLAHSGLMFQSLLSGANIPNGIQDIQAHLDRMVNAESNILKLSANYPSYNFQTMRDYPIQYQLWDNNQQLLLHSHNASSLPLSDGRVGFSNTVVDGVHWRVLTIYMPNTDRTLIIGSRHSLQAWLRQALAKDDVYIMLLTFPILGILIWIILAHGLNSLEKVTNELSQRAPNFLEPVNIAEVPEEIAGLIDELNKLLLRLRQTLEREQRFASDAAHELRTPLAAIRTQAQVALKASSDPGVIDALEKVISGVERSTHVVAQLLTLSKLVPGSPLVNQSNVDVVRIAQEIITEIIPIALDNDIELSLYPDKPNITLFANGITIGIMLRNLIDNAIRYIPHGGKVDIYIFDHPNSVCIRVVDNGPGIPPKLRARVFERFFRVLGTKSQGSGLGLAIVQQIAGLHGAQVILGAPEVGTGLEVDIIFSKKM
jgi:two-component system sensor histidine kinase QseC